MAKEDPKHAAPTQTAASKEPAQTQGAPTQGAQTSAPDEPPQGWQQIGGERLVYKPEFCNEKSLQGTLLARLTMENGPNGEPWSAYIIRASKDTLGVDREEVVHDVKAGDEILLPETYRLSDLQRAAAHPTHTFEVWIKPIKQQALGGGKKMWLYRIHVNPKSKVRSENDRLFVGPAQPAQLAAASGNGGGGIAQSEPDVPFG